MKTTGYTYGILFSLILQLMVVICALGQQTVFGLFKSDGSLANRYYEDKNYQDALQLYQNAARKKPSVSEHELGIARCYYSLKQPEQAIGYYDKYLKEKQTLPWSDLYRYAEAQAATSNYRTAIDYYRKYLAKDSNDEMVLKKIWRLTNIQYLYEDSAQYEVRPVPINTEAGELCASFYKNGIVFMSNRKETEVIEKVNAAVNAPFYKIYFSGILDSGSDNEGKIYSPSTAFDMELTSRFNAGPAAFYDGDQKMVFVSSGRETGIKGKRTLQLFFGEMKAGKWSVTHPFPFNSSQYSVSDPAITEDGLTLYFSSDMDGGYGGRDLYKSSLVNGKWSRPVNLGETINTSQDEVFPYVHLNRTLYFSSNGHPGMGGLDIFKAAIIDNMFSDPENVGYPVNSSHDDFGITLDARETHGYFSSNREHGGFNDDLYELDMDLQTYPVTISGVLKYKEITWGDSLDLKIMAHTNISLIDNIKNVVVHESITSDDGHFSIVIPYFSTYVIRVTGEDEQVNMAVLEIPKRRKELSDHEIVIVKDIFKENETQDK